MTSQLGITRIAAQNLTSIAADHGRIAKLDRDDAPKPPDKIDPAVGKALAQARSDKKNADGKSMTQKELATAVNARPNDVC